MKTCYAFLIFVIMLAACSNSPSNEQIEATVNARLTDAAPTSTPLPTATIRVDPDKSFETAVRHCNDLMASYEQLRRIVVGGVGSTCAADMPVMEDGFKKFSNCISALPNPENNLLINAKSSFENYTEYQSKFIDDLKKICATGQFTNSSYFDRASAEYERFLSYW